MNEHPIVDPLVTKLKNAETQSEALTELRSVLMIGLRRAFKKGTGGDSFCEDVAQESLMRVLDKLDSFQGRSRLTSWAMAIAVRIGTAQIRKGMFKDVTLSSLSSEEEMQIEFKDTTAQSSSLAEDRHSMIDTLRQVISTRLTDKQRQATEALLQGMPVEVIASKLNSNRNATYKLVHDARLRLKRGLEESGYSASDIMSAFS